MSPDTSSDVADRQRAVYARMAPDERVRLAVQMSEMTREIAMDGIRQRHPDYSDDDVISALFRLLHGDDLFAKAWPNRPLLPA
jgi:hypothetical protein